MAYGLVCRRQSAVTFRHIASNSFWVSEPLQLISIHPVGDTVMAAAMANLRA